MKKLIGILALVTILCLAMVIPGLAVKIAPYSQPLHDIVHWDAKSEKLIIMNPEGEALTAAWPATVDLWNYDGNTWTFDLPSGNKFAFSKGVDVTGISSITLSSSATTGTIRTLTISQTMTVASSIYAEALSVKLISDVKMGGSANAIFAQLDYVEDGYAHGEGAVIAAELSMPSVTSPTRGEYAMFKMELDIPTACSLANAPIALLKLNVWGGAETEFDDHGYLFDFEGVSSGANDFFYLSDITVTKADGTLKIRIKDIDYYIWFSTVQTGGD